MLRAFKASYFVLVLNGKNVWLWRTNIKRYKPVVLLVTYSSRYVSHRALRNLFIATARLCVRVKCVVSLHTVYCKDRAENEPDFTG